MKKVYLVLFTLLSLFTTKAVAEVPSKGGIVKAGTVYDIPIKGEEGYIADNTVDFEVAATAGQYIVVFLNAPDASKKAIDFTNIFYNYAGSKNYNIQSVMSTSKDGSFTYRRYYYAGPQAGIDIYAEDQNKQGSGYSWCYVIVDSEAEIATVKNPADQGEGEPAQPGQDIENAILLSQGTTTSFTSCTSGSNHLIYLKVIPAFSGTITMNLGAEATYARWMEEGIIAYGQLKQNMFIDGNKFRVEKGKTYYCLYQFAQETKSSVSYSLQQAGPGETRDMAINITSQGTFDLLGIPHYTEGDETIYENKTTWFRIAQGTFPGSDLIYVKLDGGLHGDIELFEGESGSIKSYAIGTGSGMLPVNPKVQFDANLDNNDYYIAITQEDAGGKATFTFKKAEPGESMKTALQAFVGRNTPTKGGLWYYYTHQGERKNIVFSGISTVYDAEGGLISSGDDVALGFAINDGQTVYVQAPASGFTITLSSVDKGMSADDPIIIDNNTGATFKMGSSAATDAYRYMKYTATEDGTFLYATDNKKVLEYHNSATIRDITNPDAPKTVTAIQEESTDFGDKYFIYKWTVQEGHTYLIEQGLGNNYGTVTFFTLFTAAEAGETYGKAIIIEADKSIDLGRKTAMRKYYSFTATETSDYTISAHLQGYVRVYSSESTSYSVPVNYDNGLIYHNETVSLAAGEKIVISCEPSADIEHFGGDIDDSYLPNYYISITSTDSESGIDYNAPILLNENESGKIVADKNIWYGIIEVPAGNTFTVTATLAKSSDKNALYLACEDEYGQFQWVSKPKELSVSPSGTKQIYTLSSANRDRKVLIMSCGLVATGTLSYTGGTTAVDALPSRTITTSSAIHTLSGAKTSNLQKGNIYIIGGKTTLMK